ncbi:uncharacterized protein FA14DRAFT_160979 [Meira miltonrushii]|uniref:Nucleoside diphosphate kinase n=1 Tax=Meira miltonrushii TaxID=1280837 RepID=A0A316VJA5_9BASI|nr:uncharacterized protein FA14DRAFT_160979 [Meira miltonrushii]PWN36111.1 hypothetical protein FA14DRAFT_160979 [Meira miltonrushii]
MDTSSTNQSSPSRTATRTLAILTHSACSEHRSAIQAEITSKGFAILSERKEQWSSQDDVDFLHEFLRDPLASPTSNDTQNRTWMKALTDHPIYVMVLERNRAAELWQEMCGTSKDNSGLRSQYGEDAVYAPSARLASRQIAICFPELATSEALAALQLDIEDPPNTIMATDSNGAFLVREDDDIVYDEKGQAFDAHNGEPLELQEELVISKEALPSTSSDDHTRPLEPQRVFKARPLPASHKQATSQPRLSRAAALRMGVALPEAPKKAVSNVSSGDMSNRGISGLPKANVAIPKSLQAPTIAPRMNRSAAARTNKGGSVSNNAQSAPSESGSSVKERKPVDFSNTPGHKRVSTGGFKLASLAAPAVAPRLNKAAAARTGGHSGSASTQSPERIRVQRPASVSYGSETNKSDSPIVRKQIDFSNTPGHKRASMSTSTLKSLQAPSIVPRGNRASLARVGGNANDASSSPERRSGTNGKTTITAADTTGKENRSGRTSVTSTQTNKLPSGRLSVASTTTRDVRTISGRASVASTRDARERKPIDFSNTPGHKRASQSISIASLAQPTIAPRSNSAAQKRLSVGAAPSKASTGTSGRMAIRNGAPPSSFRV